MGKSASGQVDGAAPSLNLRETFAQFARVTANASGKPAAFLLAVLVVLVWATTGPIFHYSDTWQLVINTGTTIVTFLMVFLIQNTQNRDTMAIQLKLSELVLAMRGAENRIALAEEMTDEELEALHQECRVRADQALESLTARRKAKLAAEKQTQHGAGKKAQQAAE
jgi:low affinity Fe/Cu permease